MKEVDLIKDLTFKAFTQLVQEMSHAGLIIMVVRPDGFALPETETDEVTESVSFGGCAGCLANAIAQKMLQDDNLCTIITAAVELYQSGSLRIKCKTDE